MPPNQHEQFALLALFLSLLDSDTRPEPLDDEGIRGRRSSTPPGGTVYGLTPPRHASEPASRNSDATPTWHRS